MIPFFIPMSLLRKPICSKHFKYLFWYGLLCCAVTVGMFQNQLGTKLDKFASTYLPYLLNVVIVVC